MAERRRSTRAKVPTKKFDKESVDDHGDEESETESDRPVVSNRKRGRPARKHDDDDFENQDSYAPQGVESDEVDDEDQPIQATALPHQGPNSDGERDEEPDASHIRSSRRKRHGSIPEVDAAQYARIPAYDARNVRVIGGSNIIRSRGLKELVHNPNRINNIRATYGPGSEDLKAYLHDSTKWFSEMTLPTRKSAADGSGGLAYSMFNPIAGRARREEQYHQWYVEKSGRDWFQQKQESEEMPCPDLFAESRGCNVLLGPINDQHINRIESGGAIPLPAASRPNTTTLTKLGWLLNLGGKIQCLEWVPNQESKRQFLSVVVLAEVNQAEQSSSKNAFEPQPEYRGSMQIWEFRAESVIEIGAQPSLSHDPTLVALFTWDWGDLKRMSWCPINTLDSDAIEDKHSLRLGMLAGIWTDGKLRVLDLAIQESTSGATTYMHITKAAFESRPLDTVCTCVVWLSSSSLAAGCASGSVGVWSLRDQVQTNRVDDDDNALPSFWEELHTSYIISITSGYPSRPYLIFTLSLDGGCRMTDLRAPTQDYCYTARTRVAQGAVAWHDSGQCCLFTDEQCTMKAATARRFFTTTQMTKLSSFGTDIAVSPVHPLVLCSTVDGAVWASNPLRRIKSLKVDSFAQIWFRHEWRRALDGDDPILSQPLCRFLEGYKVDTVRGSFTHSDTHGDDEHNDAGLVATYEEQTAATRVCWNPNLRCGTWAAVGMADGLVRVEDIGLGS